MFFSALLLMLIKSAIAPNAQEDGWHSSQEFLLLYEPTQKAVINWD